MTTDQLIPSNPQELKELLSDLSLQATGQSWHAQTSNAGWFLLWFGGRWGNAHASEIDTLDRIRTIATDLGLWPVIQTAADLGREPETIIGFVDYRDFRDARLATIGGRPYVVTDRIHLRTDASSRICPLDPPDIPGTPVAGPPRLSKQPWCVRCAIDVQQDIAATLDWELDAAGLP